MQENELVQKIASVLWDRKALDIVALDVRELTVLCDYMIIASGRNANQVKALYDDVDEVMAKASPCAAPRAPRKAAGWCWTTPPSWSTSSTRKSARSITWNVSGMTAPTAWSSPLTRPPRPETLINPRGGNNR